MQDFFHADTSKYPKRLKAIIVSVLVPFSAICIFCAANIIFNMRSDGDKSLAQLMIYIIAGCVALGIIICFSAAYIVEKKIRRHARFTYIDILPKGVIYSRYAGEYYIYGERTIIRRLYYIPFSQMNEILRDPKHSPACVTIKGEIRSYLFPSDELGYHINEDGDSTFNHADLNDRFFETLSVLKIDSDFGSTKRLVRSLEHYREVFKNTPEKKQFDITEHIANRPKRHTGTSNPMLDAPSYNRKW